MLPLRIVFTPAAEAELAEGYAWLATFGQEVAEHWLNGLTSKLDREADLAATVPLRRRRAPDAPEGVELFVLLYRTQGRRGSPWHIVYQLRDEDGDGAADTLSVIRVRHAAIAGR